MAGVYRAIHLGRMTSGTILLAEDDDMVRLFVCSVLQRHGYRVLEANDGAAALALAMRVGVDEIDLVVTDVDMPVLTGIQLARCLKRWRPELKILYMTGDPAVHLDELGREGVVIEKPFAYGTLVRGVDTCLSQVRPARAGV
jgi:CheY-like chemotaxis protein